MYDDISQRTFGKMSTVGHTPTLEKPRCGSCVHQEVCYFRLEGKRPRTIKRKVEVFGNMVTIEECHHYLRL